MGEKVSAIIALFFMFGMAALLAWQIIESRRGLDERLDTIEQRLDALEGE